MKSAHQPRRLNQGVQASKIMAQDSGLAQSLKTPAPGRQRRRTPPLVARVEIQRNRGWQHRQRTSHTYIRLIQKKSPLEIDNDSQALSMPVARRKVRRGRKMLSALVKSAMTNRLTSITDAGSSQVSIALSVLSMFMVLSRGRSRARSPPRISSLTSARTLASDSRVSRSRPSLTGFT